MRVTVRFYDPPRGLGALDRLKVRLYRLLTGERFVHVNVLAGDTVYDCNVRDGFHAIHARQWAQPPAYEIAVPIPGHVTLPPGGTQYNMVRSVLSTFFGIGDPRRAVNCLSMTCRIIGLDAEIRRPSDLIHHLEGAVNGVPATKGNPAATPAAR